jgi:putative intracellular protease/amidase
MSFKVLFVMTSQSHFGDSESAAGSWLEEFAAPYFVLTDAGHTVEFATIQGGQAPIDPVSLDAPWLTDAGRRLLDDAGIIARLSRTPSLKEVDAASFDGLYMVGGAAVMWDFPHDRTLGELLRSFSSSGRVFGGVCHGVSGLLNPHAGPDLVKGRRLTCISNQEDELAGFDKIVPSMPETPLRNAGAQLTFAAEPFAANAVRDGNLVTGQNPASAASCGQLLIEALSARQSAKAG